MGVKNKVLIVDDNNINQMVAQHFISQAGYQSDLALNG